MAGMSHFRRLALLLPQAFACQQDLDCSLNGKCVSGRCECEAPWKGASCGLMDFIPAPQPSAAYGYNPNVTSWGGNAVLGDDGLFHLFVTEIAGKGCGLSAWKHNSQVVHATAQSPNGPYERKGVALPVSSHNPQIVRFKDDWLIFHIYPALNSSYSDCDSELWQPNQGEVPLVSQIHSSRSLDGPWLPVNTTMPACTNPAPWVLQNGTLALACTADHGGNFTIIMADSLDGPWTSREIWPAVSPPDIRPHKFWEDPFLWVDARGNWHILMHTYSPHQLEINDYISGHIYSLDGFEWFTNNVEPYHHEVSFANGVKQNFSTIERPKLLFDKAGRATHLFNGVSSYWPDGCAACGGCTACKINGGTDWTYTLVRELSVEDFGFTCTTDADCSLNGRCAGGKCQCETPWKGETCGILDFQPLPTPSAAYGYSPNVTSWGGNVVIGDDGLYHLFVTEIAGKNCGLSAWKHNSQVIHATAGRPEGPYTRQEVALPVSAHNPHAIRFGNDWLLFHIYPALNDTVRDCDSLVLDDLEEQPMVSQIHRSKTLDGPWMPVNTTMPDCTNPAPWVLSNGTLAVVCSPGTGNPNFRLLMSDSLVGVWSSREIWPGVSPASIWPHKFWEDPVLWIDTSGNWHVLMHTYSPHQNEDRDYISGHIFSSDGVEWSTNDVEPYGHSVEYDDGLLQNFSTIERPKLLLDAGRPSYLFNGVSSYWPGGCGPCGGCTECKVTQGIDWTYTMVRRLGRQQFAI